MKKLGMHIIGALLLSSIPMHSGHAFKKRRFFECQSDKKITGLLKYKYKSTTIPEYTAEVNDIVDTSARFVAKRNYVLNGQVKTQTLESSEVRYEGTGTFLIFQGQEWAIAIAPHKKRASLYSSNPDLNEIPMFCLSQRTI